MKLKIGKDKTPKQPLPMIGGDGKSNKGADKAEPIDESASSGQSIKEPITKKTKRKPILFLGAIILIAGSIGGVYYYMQNETTKDQNVEEVSQLEEQYKELVTKATENPEDVDAQTDASVARGELAQEYSEQGNEDQAVALASGGDTISQLEAQSVLLQQKEDWAGALNVHRQLLEEYKKLPDENPLKKAEIERAERKIKELEGLAN